MLHAPSDAFSPSISLSNARLGTCGHESQELIGHIGGEQCGDLSWVISRQHLHYVERDEAQTTQATQQLQCLPTSDTADLCRARGRGESGIDGVHIGGQEWRARGDAFTHCLSNSLDTTCAQLVVVDEREAQIAG